MFHFDASSMIYAWDNYPLEQFPSLWTWMHRQIESNLIAMSVVAFDEVERKAPDCALWLKNSGVVQIPIANRALELAMRIKQLLAIEGDSYKSGVGENDILIIAIAKLESTTLVSDEARQNILPKVLANLKIPAVCNLPDVEVPCVGFVKYIKNSGAVFG